MGNVNMEAKQVHVRNNSHKTWHTVADAIAALDNQDTMVNNDIEELYTRDSSRANKDDIANEFSAEQAYYTGDFVYYQGSLFKFTADHAAGAWNPEDVAPEQIGPDIAILKSGLTNLDNEVNGDATVYPYADVITIPDAVPANVAGCIVKIEPVQSGSGDPPPENVRPITGHTEVSVEVTDGDETTKIYTIALGDTIYGGTVDFDSGVMTGTDSEYDLGDLTWGYDQNNKYFFATAPSTIKLPSDNDSAINGVCSIYPVASISNILAQSDDAIGVSASGYVVVKDARYTDATEFDSAVTGQKLVCELATPFTVQLTPQLIQLLKGTNTITASTGQISVTVNGVSGSIGAVQEQANELAEDVAELAADIAEKLPTAPTTDGAYVLTVTVADGTPTYSWESAT